MATQDAIATVSTAILGLLADARPRPEFETAEFKLYQLKDFDAPMTVGISLFLYRVAVNLTQRNQPSRPSANGTPRKRALPLDLHYLLTPWAGTAERQQRLLGWAMRTLEDSPVLPAGFLNNHGPDPSVFRPDEGVELTFDPMTPADLFELWEVLKHPQIAVGYVVRMVSLESTREEPTGPRVQHRGFEVGLSVP